MKKNNIKLKQIFSACLIATGSLMASTSANAASVGWPVVNVMDNFYYNSFFGSMGQFTKAMGQQNDAIRGAVDAHRSTTELQIKQGEQNQHDSDMRLRMALGQADIAKRDFEQMPTLKQCTELTVARVNSVVIGAGETRSGNGGAGTKLGREQTSVANISIANTQQDIATNLKNNSAAGTCTPALAGIAGCSGSVTDTKIGEAATQEWKKMREAPTRETEFLGSDTHMYGILGNSSGIEKTNKLGDYANYSMTGQMFEEVAGKYIKTATTLNGPNTIVKKESKEKNPAFFVKFSSYETKINAAADTLTEIAKLRIAAPVSAYQTNTVAGDILTKFQDKYAMYFPHLKKPDSPSMFEMLRFNVIQDYFFDEKVTGDVAAMQEIQLKRMALQNLIMLKSYEQQERNNILLSHILVQLTNPVDVRALNAEALSSDVKLNNRP